MEEAFGESDSTQAVIDEAVAVDAGKPSGDANFSEADGIVDDTHRNETV